MVSERPDAPVAHATPKDLEGLFGDFNRLTEALRRSHDELEARVERLQLELAEKNRELERKKRLEALGRIAAGLAHEIRNPLGSVVLYLDLLREEVAGRDRAIELLWKIRKGVDLMDAIVRDVLTFAKPDRIRPETCRLAAVLREAAGLVEAEAQAAGVAVRVEGNGGATVDADRDQLRRVFINLLRNAVEASPPGGTVDALAESGGAEGRDGMVAVSIRDRGPGIPEEDLDKIFLPFWSGKERGTGLGLAIVHTLVEAHGGEILVENRTGGGARVTVLLPAAGGS
ncbi:MAG: hypothetical protein JXP34_20290 [Planctomycetes bacterium]|nr:hypothetical protein [Planctomycetota bacterium]